MGSVFHLWTGSIGLGAKPRQEILLSNGPLIHWDCSIWNSFDFASNWDFFLATKQHKKSVGFARNPEYASRSVVMSICQSTFINRDRVPRSAALYVVEGQSARDLHSCGPVRGSSRRSVTATLQFARHRTRTLVSTKFMHENNFYKMPPENLRGTAGIQLLVVQKKQNTIHEMSDSLCLLCLFVAGKQHLRSGCQILKW